MKRGHFVHCRVKDRAFFVAVRLCCGLRHFWVTPLTILWQGWAKGA
jgi:hypothetical protein